MRTGTSVAAALVAAAAWFAVAAGPAPAGDEGPVPALEINPFKVGLVDWEKSGPKDKADKAFNWSAEDASLVVKGQSGKEPPTLFYGKVAWDRFEMSLRVKKFSRRIRFLFRPEAGGEAIPLDVPREAVKDEAWNELLLRVGEGKARLLHGDGEVASADLPEGKKVRVGFDGSYGSEGVVTDLRLRRRYEDGPQFAEEGFTPLFDGTLVAPWFLNSEEMGPAVTVQDGLLIVDVRSVDFVMLGLGGREFKEYDWRFNVLWNSSGLVVRPVEVPGVAGQIDKFNTTQVNLSDNLDPLGVSAVRILVEKGKCIIEVNGRTVFDQKTGNYEKTGISFNVPKGKKCLLRDIRIRDLAPK